jgi:predicted metal-dependent phosphoesterase TrpH
MSGPPPTVSVRRVDLHSHTFFSDGALSPEELVARALKRGIAALGLTDHDSVEGIPRARAASGSVLELVPGVELSTTLDGLDLHVLGYYIDDSEARLRARLDEFKEERRSRVAAIVDRLRELGVTIELERVLALAGPGVVGRPHVAQAMLEIDAVFTQDEAFKRYLGFHGPAFVPRPAFTPFEAIELIQGAGGVSVIAHPGSLLADAIIERLAEAGLKGIEVWHPHHTTGTVRRYRSLARRLHLVETGGSDFHGERRSADLGEIKVPFTALEALRRAAGIAG